MKKYFVKYLPTGKEIKGIRELFDKSNPYHKAGFDYLDAIEDRKFFLCSKDITVDDFGTTYHSSEDTLIATENTHWRIKDFGYYKIIGEISPDVKWVKENDEFDDEEIQIVGENKYGERHPLWMYKPEDEPKIYCEIKGPCGHYH